MVQDLPLPVNLVPLLTLLRRIPMAPKADHYDGSDPHHRLMPVPVAVRLSLCIIGVMLVQMVLVVAV